MKAQALERLRRRRRYNAIFNEMSAFTMIHRDRFIANLAITEYASTVPGVIVECGTWRGGMIAGLAKCLGPERHYVLFDSFEGLPPAEDIDGPGALAWQADTTSPQYFDNCRAEQDEALTAMRLAGIESPELVPGWFHDTVPQWAETNDQPIAVLRLDGDWYESTIVCLRGLFSAVAPGGVVIIDDYGTWDGCTRAVHTFLAEAGRPEAVQKTKSGVSFLLKQESGLPINRDESSAEELPASGVPDVPDAADGDLTGMDSLEQPWSVRRLNALLSRMPGPTSYLEIGVDRGETFRNVRADLRIGVDPDPQFSLDELPDDAGFFVGDPDDFFAGLHREVRFDVVFLDGVHEFERTYDDLISALQRVGEHGAILIDDTVPCDAISAIPDREASFELRRSLGDTGLPWHGDVWKVVAAIAEGHPNLDYRTIVSSGNPQTLVWRRRGPLVEERFDEGLVDRIDALSYDDFFDDRSLPAFMRTTSESDALACWAER